MDNRVKVTSTTKEDFKTNLPKAIKGLTQTFYPPISVFLIFFFKWNLPNPNERNMYDIYVLFLGTEVRATQVGAKLFLSKCFYFKKLFTYHFEKIRISLQALRNRDYSLPRFYTQDLIRWPSSANSGHLPFLRAMPVRMPC